MELKERTIDFPAAPGHVASSSTGAVSERRRRAEIIASTGHAAAKSKLSSDSASMLRHVKQKNGE